MNELLVLEGPRHREIKIATFKAEPNISISCTEADEVCSQSLGKGRNTAVPLGDASMAAELNASARYVLEFGIQGHLNPVWV